MEKTTSLPTIEQRLSRCRTAISKFQLFSAIAGTTTKINGVWGSGNVIEVNGYAVYLKQVQREDGSGSSFNLIVAHGGKDYKVYLRTTD
jgi:hypothetical protein